MTDNDSHTFRNMTPTHVFLNKRKFIILSNLRRNYHNVTMRTLTYPHTEFHIFLQVLSNFLNKLVLKKIFKEK
jgi:hypothetical protein